MGFQQAGVRTRNKPQQDSSPSSFQLRIRVTRSSINAFYARKFLLAWRDDWRRRSAKGDPGVYAHTDSSIGVSLKPISSRYSSFELSLGPNSSVLRPIQAPKAANMGVSCLPSQNPNIASYLSFSFAPVALSSFAKSTGQR